MAEQETNIKPEKPLPNYTHLSEDFLKHINAQLNGQQVPLDHRELNGDKKDPSGYLDFVSQMELEVEYALNEKKNGTKEHKWLDKLKGVLDEYHSSEDNIVNPFQFVVDKVKPLIENDDDINYKVKIPEIDEDLKEHVKDEVNCIKAQVERDLIREAEEQSVAQKNNKTHQSFMPNKDDYKKRGNQEYTSNNSDRISRLARENEELRASNDRLAQRSKETAASGPQAKQQVQQQGNMLAGAINKTANAFGRTIGSGVEAAKAAKKLTRNSISDRLDAPRPKDFPSSTPKKDGNTSQPSQEHNELAKTKLPQSQDPKLINSSFQEMFRQHDTIDLLREKAIEAAKNKDQTAFNKFTGEMNEAISDRLKYDKKHLDGFDKENIGEGNLTTLKSRYEKHNKGMRSLQKAAKDNGLEYDRDTGNALKKGLEKMLEEIRKAVEELIRSITNAFKKKNENTKKDEPAPTR